jgi:hypothetical protein
MMKKIIVGLIVIFALQACSEKMTADTVKKLKMVIKRMARSNLTYRKRGNIKF